MKKPEIARKLFPPPVLEGPTLQHGSAERWQAYWNARTLVLHLQRYPADVLRGLADVLRGLADELARQRLPPDTLDRLFSAATKQASRQE